MPLTYELSDEDRFNNFLQILMRCYVKVMRKLLPYWVRWLGYASVETFLSIEMAHIQRMPYASSPKSQAILYPPPLGTLTDIEQWDLSLLHCIYTQIQRKIILHEFGNPIDHVLITNRTQVISTQVGRAHRDMLYPASGLPTDIHKWSMSVCSCILSVLSPKPQTLLVRIAESLDDIREQRNGLCHPENPEMTPADYERQMPLLKTLIDSVLVYLGDDAFETELKKEIDDIENSKMKKYLMVDHRHLQQSYHNDRDIIQRLENIEKAVQELPNQGNLNLLVFFGNLPKEQRDLLYANYIETFTECLEKNIPEAVENEDLKQQITLASCMAWKILENPYQGRHVLGVRRKCLEVKIGFDNVLWMWTFIKDYLYGRLELTFEPMQTLLRRQEGFENLEITVAIPNMFTALMHTGQAVPMDIDSVLFMLEMMFQQSRRLGLEQIYTAVRSRSTQTSQLQIPNVSIQSRDIQSEGLEETLFEKMEQMFVDESKRPLEKLLLDPFRQVKTLIPAEEFTINELGEKVKFLQPKDSMDEQSIKEFTICESAEKSLTPDRPDRPMAKSSPNVISGHQTDDFGSLKFYQAPVIPVKSPSDIYQGWLTSMLLLPGDRLLITDVTNLTVNLVDLQCSRLLSHVMLSDGPLSMCFIPEEWVAVSSGFGGIKFLNTQGQLSQKDDIKVNGRCLGIGYFDDRLVVSYNSGKVEIMDMSGKVIKQIDKDDCGVPLFLSPSSLTVVSEAQETAIYVSDALKHTITKLDSDLTILQTFQDPALRAPRGMIAVGNQLVICGEESNNIMCLDLPSNKMTQLLGRNDCIYKPISVCYSQQQNKLCVICGQYTNVVSVYMTLFKI